MYLSASQTYMTKMNAHSQVSAAQVLLWHTSGKDRVNWKGNFSSVIPIHL